MLFNSPFFTEYSSKIEIDIELKIKHLTYELFSSLA